MGAAEGIGVGVLTGRSDVETTALGTEVEFLTAWFVFGSDTVRDYSYDACACFDSSSHKCLFLFAYEWRYEDTLRPDRFFPCGFVVLSFCCGISAAYYCGCDDRMLQQLEIAVEVHFFVEDSDSLDSAE